MRIIKNIGRGLLILTILLVGIIGLASFIIEYYSRNKTYTTLNEIPYNRVGLLLGTSKKIISGSSNPYFTNRIKAAASLYKAGKVDRIIISGDNSERYYNEPEDMRRALVKEGVNNEHLYLDYAGFRTLDSVVRTRKIFKENKVTVISQEFHNKRAIFLGRVFEVDIIGYNAQDIGVAQGAKVMLREKLARVKVFIDILTNKKPKYLGEPIPII